MLDLSNNSLSDLSELGSLQYLEELYLANNQIGIIDSLNNLVNLRIIDLSGNMIDDISPLLNLEHLESINLFDNEISLYQKNLLTEKDVLVVI